MASVVDLAPPDFERVSLRYLFVAWEASVDFQWQPASHILAYQDLLVQTVQNMFGGKIKPKKPAAFHPLSTSVHQSGDNMLRTPAELRDYFMKLKGIPTDGSG